MFRTHSTRKTAPKIEHNVVSLIAQGVRYADIHRQTNVPVSTIKKIKKRNAARLQRIEQIITERQAVEVVRILQRSNERINEKLEQDSAGFSELSISELLAISHEMYGQIE